jgi:hypothetical protein
VSEGVSEVELSCSLLLLWLAGSGMGVGAGLGEGVGASRYFVERAVCWLGMGRFTCMPKFLVAVGKV